MPTSPVPAAINPSIRDRLAPVPGGHVHFLEKGSPSPDRPTLLFCPGNWEPAWRAIPMLEGLEGHALAVTARGHHPSLSPERGYGLEEHVMDLQAVVDVSAATRICVAGFSRGVGYALGYWEAHPENVCGLVLMDAPPVHGRPEQGYAAYWGDKIYQGYRIRDHWHPHAMAAMTEEAVHVHFPDVIPRVDIPVLLLRGTSRTSPVPSSLSDQDIDAYRTWIPHIQIERLEHAGHMVLDEALGHCRKALDLFLRRLSPHKESLLVDLDTSSDTLDRC